VDSGRQALAQAKEETQASADEVANALEEARHRLQVAERESADLKIRRVKDEEEIGHLHHEIEEQQRVWRIG